MVEYSAEEEVILNDETYAPICWQLETTFRAVNEWSLEGPPEATR